MRTVVDELIEHIELIKIARTRENRLEQNDSNAADLEMDSRQYIDKVFRSVQANSRQRPERRRKNETVLAKVCIPEVWIDSETNERSNDYVR